MALVGVGDGGGIGRDAAASLEIDNVDSVGSDNQAINGARNHQAPDNARNGHFGEAICPEQMRALRVVNDVEHSGGEFSADGGIRHAC